MNANTDPPLNPLPTKEGEEKITGQSLTDGHIMPASLPCTRLRYRLPDDYTSFPFGHFGKSFVGRNAPVPTVPDEDKS